MRDASIHDQVATLAQSAGFSSAGIAPIPPPGEEAASDYPELSYFEPWIERGRAGEMQYLKRRDDAGQLLRSSLRIAVPWARSVVVCAANYNPDAPKSIDPAPPETAWIARYASDPKHSGGAAERLPRCAAGAPEETGAELATGARPLLLALLRGYRSFGRADLRQVRGDWLDWKEYLHD